MTHGTRHCIVEGCGDVLSPRSVSPYCKRCRAGIGYWTRRPLAALVHRTERLKVFAARTALVLQRRRK